MGDCTRSRISRNGPERRERLMSQIRSRSNPPKGGIWNGSRIWIGYGSERLGGGVMQNEAWIDRERNKWQAYEIEKKRIQRENLPAHEYEAKLQTVIERLGL